MLRFLLGILAVVRRIKSLITTLLEKIESLNEGFHYLGSVNTVNDLPNDAAVGDKYTVISESNAEYIWDGTAWRNQSPAITKQQIDSLYE